MARSFLTLNDITSDEFKVLIDRAAELKLALRTRQAVGSLQNRVVALLFEKPSTRTRTSFETATDRLGGKAVYLESGNMQLKRGEPIKDTARILGSYDDMIVARVFAHDTVEQFADWSGQPVVNALSDLTHPTQIVCDLFTIKEEKGHLEGLTLAYIGDGNNVCNSLLLGCTMMGMNVRVARPDKADYQPDATLLADAEKNAAATGASILLTEYPAEAAADADILYTDVWVSMGEDDEATQRREDFQGYQINADLVAQAAPDAKVMHCLPAHRGLEITDDVIEGPRSIVFAQGENKMHGAAAILEFFME